MEKQADLLVQEQCQFMVSECSCGLGKELMFLILGGCLRESARDHEGGIAPFEGFWPEARFLGGVALVSLMRGAGGGPRPLTSFYEDVCVVFGFRVSWPFVRYRFLVWVGLASLWNGSDLWWFCFVEVVLVNTGVYALLLDFFVGFLPDLCTIQVSWLQGLKEVLIGSGCRWSWLEFVFVVS
jgi:hypothetical protein